MSQSDSRSERIVLRPIDWTLTRTLVVMLGVLTSGIHAYVGVTTGDLQFILMGGGLLAGVIVFFTVFWRPVLYLIGIIYVTVLIVVWILNGMQFFAIGFADTIVQLALISLFFYLFAAEFGSERHSSED